MGVIAQPLSRGTTGNRERVWQRLALPGRGAGGMRVGWGPEGWLGALAVAA